MIRPALLGVGLLLAGCSAEEPPPASVAGRAAGPSSTAPLATPARRASIVHRSKPFAELAPPARSATPPMPAAAKPKPRVPFADLMTRAVPIVARADQRRWLELRRRLGAREMPDLSRLSPDERRAFAEIVATLEREAPTHPVVAEILRRTRDAS